MSGEMIRDTLQILRGGRILANEEFEKYWEEVYEEEPEPEFKPGVLSRPKMNFSGESELQHTSPESAHPASNKPVRQRPSYAGAAGAPPIDSIDSSDGSKSPHLKRPTLFGDPDAMKHPRVAAIVSRILNNTTPANFKPGILKRPTMNFVDQSAGNGTNSAVQTNAQPRQGANQGQSGATVGPLHKPRKVFGI